MDLRIDSKSTTIALNYKRPNPLQTNKSYPIKIKN